MDLFFILYFFHNIYRWKVQGLKKIKIESNMIKDIRNLFRLKRELNDTAIKDIRNLFRLKKENKAIKKKSNWRYKKSF